MVLTGELEQAAAWLRKYMTLYVDLFGEVYLLASFGEVSGLMGNPDHLIAAFSGVASVSGKKARRKGRRRWGSLALESTSDSPPYAKLAGLILRAGRVTGVRRFIWTATRASGSTSNQADSAHAALMNGWCDLIEGRLVSAEENIKAAERAFGVGTWVEHTMAVMLVRARLEARRSAWDAADDQLDQVLSMAASRGFRLHQADALALRASFMLERAAGDTESTRSAELLECAGEQAMAALELARACGYFWARLDALGTLVEVNTRLKNPAAARRYQAEHLAYTSVARRFHTWELPRF